MGTGSAGTHLVGDPGLKFPIGLQSVARCQLQAPQADALYGVWQDLIQRYEAQIQYYFPELDDIFWQHRRFTLRVSCTHIPSVLFQMSVQKYLKRSSAAQNGILIAPLPSL